MADSLDVQRSAYAQYEREDGTPFPARLMPRLQALGWRPAEEGGPTVGVLTPATSPETSGLLGLRAGKMGKLKLVGSIGAGDADPWEIDEGSVYVPLQFAREDFGGFVAHRSAISLMPYIQPGDLVVVRLTKTPRIGKIGAVRGEGDMPVVKSVEWDGGQMVLRSTSEAFPDIKDGQIDYLGVLVGIASADGGLLIGPYDQGLGIDDLRKIFGGRL